MPDPAGLDPLPHATIDPPKRRRLSVIWIIPILAAVVAIGIAVQRILTEGPNITVVFKSAEGIEAGKTFVKYTITLKARQVSERRGSFGHRLQNPPNHPLVILKDAGMRRY